jgi:hypothetical protein
MHQSSASERACKTKQKPFFFVVLEQTWNYSNIRQKAEKGEHNSKHLNECNTGIKSTILPMYKIEIELILPIIPASKSVSQLGYNCMCRVWSFRSTCTDQILNIFFLLSIHFDQIYTNDDM